jgi:hypothetical protein
MQDMGPVVSHSVKETLCYIALVPTGLLNINEDTTLEIIQQQTLEGLSCLEHSLDRNVPTLVVKDI